MIGIIGAMQSEVDALAEQIRNPAVTREGLCLVTAGTLWGHDVALCRCGIGKIHAALAAQLLIRAFRPSLLVNTGVAGALWEEAALGDAVIGTAAVQHDVDTSPLGDPKGMVSGVNLVEFPCDAAAADAMERAARKLGNACRGVIASGDRFIVDPEEKKSLRSEFGAMVCDMECAAIAQTAYEYAVPFAAYRCVSDTMYGTGEEFVKNLDFTTGRSKDLLRAFLEEYPKEAHRG